MVRVGIVNYGVGNLTSVANALTRLGVEPFIAEKPKEIENASHVIVPGVGSFRAGMEGLTRGGWVDMIRRIALDEKNPILGICLGLQLFADIGYEDGEWKGLSIVPGHVEKIPVKGVPLPHIGWNSVALRDKAMARNFTGEPDFYFVHSYRFVPKDDSVIAGVADYSVPVVAMIEKDNVWGAQFHPEKSQDNGMQLLKNFLAC